MYRVIHWNWNKVLIHNLGQEASLGLFSGGKAHFCSDILIFDGPNQYKWFSKLLFHLASISITIAIYDKIQTKFLKSCAKNLVWSHVCSSDLLIICSFTLKRIYLYIKTELGNLDFLVFIKHHIQNVKYFLG